jgi:VIT1/CCC1 family predicted Fe2+/Mn2+ transporter
VGATLPLAAAWVVPGSQPISVVAVSSLVFLAFLGAVAAEAGCAPIVFGEIRVTFWGALAMSLAAGFGRLFGAVAL